jgi:GntR family transcriptional regulator
MVEFVRAEGVPIYIQIRESLRADIMQGTLKRGEQLPSENDLALKYKVSRMTIRESIEDLVDEGLLYRRHGVGTFVAYPHLQRDHTRLTNFFDKAENEGLAVQAKLLKLEVIPAKPRVAEALDIPVGSHVIRVKTLRFVNEAPVTVHDAYVPHKLFANIVNENLEVQHLWTLYEKAGYRVKRAVQKLEAREASKEVANLMKIKEGAPVLFKERTVYADDGTPVEFTYCYNRGDMYSLTVASER